MKCSRFFCLFLIACLAMYVLACSVRPTEQIERTEKAMQQAKDEYADQFAPDDWKDAEDAWTAAANKLEQEKWGEAGPLLLKAATSYQKARDIAKGLRAEAIRDIEGKQSAAEKRCQTLKDGIEANAKKLKASQKESLEEACKKADEELAAVRGHVERGEYQDAKYKAEKTLREIWEAQKELDSYIGKK